MHLPAILTISFLFYCILCRLGQHVRSVQQGHILLITLVILQLFKTELLHLTKTTRQQIQFETKIK